MFNIIQQPNSKPGSAGDSNRQRENKKSPFERLLTVMQASALIMLTGIPPFLWLYTPARHATAVGPEWPGGRVIWTLVIALLPLFILSLGFYNWRRICPLAFYGRLSEWIQWPDRRTTTNAALRRKRLPKWVATWYPVITTGFLTLMLALRILLINSDASALAWTFTLLVVMAAATSFAFTGKTWCNFLCPVGAIERFYTDTDRPNYKKNSQCSRCTACKTAPSGGLCPDINQENDYWQEIRSLPRAVAYYSWPGVVLGFYLWYYLHKPYYWSEGHATPGADLAGLLPALPKTDWGYYLSGDWTREAAPWRQWMAQGFGWHGLPQPLSSLPTCVAAPITLVVCGAASFLLFRTAEYAGLRAARYSSDTLELRHERIRHTLFTLAGFLAFILFYQFAGAPTLAHLPFGLYGLFRFSVTVTAVSSLITRLHRSRVKQLRFDQARKWRNRWPIPNTEPPNDLEEAYRLVTEYMRSSEDKRQLFQNMLSGLLADNLVTASEIGLLDRMAADLNLSDADKRRVVKELNSEYPGLFTANLSDSLRLLGYRRELERSISENRGVLPADAALAAMQVRYRVDAAEHAAILDELRDPAGSRAMHLRAQVKELFTLRRDATALQTLQAVSIRFLARELTSQTHDLRDHIMEVANLYGPSGQLSALAPAVRRNDPAAQTRASNWILEHLPAPTAGLVADAVSTQMAPPAGPIDPTSAVRLLLRYSDTGDTGVRAAAIYSLEIARDAAAPVRSEARERAAAFLSDPNPLLREAAVAALAPDLTASQWSAALTDENASVRRCAIRRLPSELSPELHDLLVRSASDADGMVRQNVAVRLGANAGPDKQAMLPGMTTLERMFALRNLQLLAHLSAQDLLPIAEKVEEEIYMAGQPLCQEGDPSSHVYLLVEGETEAIRQSTEGEVRLGVNRTGECVGEMAVLDPAPRSATVRALTPIVRVLTVSGELFHQLLAQDQKMSGSIIRMLIQRQRRMLDARSE